MRPRWLNLRLALVLSLALNVFLAAALLAPQLFPPPPRERDPGRFAERLAERMPEADRPAFQQAYARHAPALRQSFSASREARQRARATLAAEPLDQAAVESALAEWRRSEAVSRAAVQTFIIDAAPNLSPEARSWLLPGRGGQDKR